jgi:uncharacterized protein (TIGR04255 family)
MSTIGHRIPKRLRKEPLLEVLWEIRFSSDKESVVELLPGLIYQAMGATYQKTSRLPAANLPPPVLQQDMALRYVPTIRLGGERYSIQIGEHLVSLSCNRPYTGWHEFKGKILELTEMLKGTNLLTRPERFSLKYIDVIPVSVSPSLEPLEVILKIGNQEITDNTVQLRTELPEDGFLHIVQIASPAKVELPTGERFDGVLLEIDTIYQLKLDDFWSSFPELLGQAHDLCKSLFFRLLTKDTIDRLEPEY